MSSHCACGEYGAAMRKFIRVKAAFGSGDSTWLTRDSTDGVWTCTADKRYAHEFKSKREAFETLLRLGGPWLNRGRIVHVRAYPKVKE